MIQWNDESTFSKGDTDRTPWSWVAKAGPISLSVHRHKDWEPTDWLLTCPLFDVSQLLAATDIDEAKKEAVDMVRTKLRAALEELGTE